MLLYKIVSVTRYVRTRALWLSAERLGERARIRARARYRFAYINLLADVAPGTARTWVGLHRYLDSATSWLHSEDQKLTIL